MYFDAEETGKRIRLLRKSRKITQEGLADKLHITADHLGKIEKARKGISIDLLIDIADYFDVSLDYLILGRKHQSDIIRDKLAGIIQDLETLKSQL